MQIWSIEDAVILSSEQCLTHFRSSLILSAWRQIPAFDCLQSEFRLLASGDLTCRLLFDIAGIDRDDREQQTLLVAPPIDRSHDGVRPKPEDSRAQDTLSTHDRNKFSFCSFPLPRVLIRNPQAKEIDAMYLQPSEWSNVGNARATGPRSIGSILRAIPEVAALRATKDRGLRNLALRRNSA